MNAVVLYLIALLSGTGEFAVSCQTGYQQPIVVIQVSGIAVNVDYADYETARGVLGLPDYACESGQ